MWHLKDGDSGVAWFHHDLRWSGPRPTIRGRFWRLRVQIDEFALHRLGQKDVSGAVRRIIVKARPAWSLGADAAVLLVLPAVE